jgi:hypothetical protein
MPPHVERLAGLFRARVELAGVEAAMFRFSIREVLLLVLVIGICLGWWADHYRLESQLEKALIWRTCAGGLEEVLRQTGQIVEWDWERSQVRVTNPGGVTYGADIKTWHPGTKYPEHLNSS